MEDPIQPRRSSRLRGGPTEDASASPSQEPEAATKSKSKSGKSSPSATSAPKRVTRSSKSVTNVTSTDTEITQELTQPRRLTRSSSKHHTEQPIAQQVTTDEPITEEVASGGSTPTQDERPIMDSLVVLSDICCKTERLPTPDANDDDMDISDGSRPGSSTPVQDEEPIISNVGTQAIYEDITPSVSSTQAADSGAVQIPVQSEPTIDSTLNQQVTADNAVETEAVMADDIPPSESGSKDNSLFDDTYEPELHFEQISAEVAQETAQAPSVRSDDATPTLDEPASPDRFTESPTSPTPGSPTGDEEGTGLLLHKSSSMVTIPLDGDDEYIRDSASGTPSLPTDIPTAEIPTEDIHEPVHIPTGVVHQPTEIPVIDHTMGE